MAEPGDPKTPADAQDEPDHDAHVGFVSAASLTGRARAPEPRPAPAPEPGPELGLAPDEEPDLFDPPPPRARPVEPGPFDRTEQTQPVAPFARPAPPEPTVPDRPHAALRQQMRGATPRPPAPALPMRLYAVYVLILLAVPTLGVSCLLALLAVLRRDAPADTLEGAHALYQKRTVFGAIAAAVVGAILVVVNVGVIVLFAMALWVLARGAYGVLKLKSGQAVPHPRSWLF